MVRNALFRAATVPVSSPKGYTTHPAVNVGRVMKSKLYIVGFHTYILYITNVYIEHKVQQVAIVPLHLRPVTVAQWPLLGACTNLWYSTYSVQVQ